MLEFSKEDFNSGHFPLEVSPDDVSGGSVSYELGTSAHDTVERRDGSVLSGDLESVSASEVLVKIGGNLQKPDRNQVKRIGLVSREVAGQQRSVAPGNALNPRAPFAAVPGSSMNKARISY